jgi:hypothetical protein
MIIPTGRHSRSAVIVGPFGAAIYGIAALFGWTIWVSIMVMYYFFVLAYAAGVFIDTKLRARKGLPARSPRHAKVVAR